MTAGRLPASLRPYRRTATFTETTVPPGLLQDHRTKAGVWGVIHVVSGRLRYTIAATGEEMMLAAGRCGIIEPEATHKVTPEGPVSFFVEFWR